MDAQGRPAEEVLGALEELTVDDGDFAGGKVFGLVFHAGHDVEELARRAHDRFVWHNALNPDVFPSLRRMTSDLVASMAWLLSGRGAVDPAPVGFLTSGGTESILMAVKTAKVRAGLPPGRGNVVLPASAHAAFAKGCDYFSLEERRVPVGPDWRADPDAMADACDDDTVLVVGSAPQYPQGVIDPIPALAAIAEERGVNCHVDACMGGLVLPFLDDLEAEWDFRVPGVTTISADIHKYGYVPKGISVILHRDRASRSRQTFTTDNWLGGAYGSSGILGTKPGGPIAAGWAVFRYLGEAGFRRLVGQAVAARARMETGVREVPGLTVLGRPEATLLAIAGDDGDGPAVDVFAVDAGLAERGWRLDRQGPPDALHATLTPIQEATVDAFLADLRAVAATAGATADRSTNYASTE